MPFTITTIITHTNTSFNTSIISTLHTLTHRSHMQILPCGRICGHCLAITVVTWPHDKIVCRSIPSSSRGTNPQPHNSHMTRHLGMLILQSFCKSTRAMHVRKKTRIACKSHIRLFLPPLHAAVSCICMLYSVGGR